MHYRQLVRVWWALAAFAAGHSGGAALGSGACSAPSLVQVRAHLSSNTPLEARMGKFPPCDDSQCFGLLAATSRACHMEHRPFSITGYSTDKQSTGELEHELADDAAGRSINHSYPGLRALDAERHIYIIEDFLSEDEMGALIRSAGSPHGSQLIQTNATTELLEDSCDGMKSRLDDVKFC